MAHLLIRGKVESYAKWRPAFDANEEARKNAGAIGDPQIFRSGDDPWEVLVLFEWDELERARQFVGSGAVNDPAFTDQPDIYFLNDV